MVGLGLLEGPGSTAFGASSDGSVVVGLSVTASGNNAFIWDSVNGMRSVSVLLTGLGIDLTGWTLVDALDVSADGTKIVGTGINPSGFSEAWLADLSPGLPAASHRSLVLLGIVLAVGGILAIGRLRKAFIT